ncbi:MAG: nitronate monooxygenase [Desulfobacterales bacterium]
MQWKTPVTDLLGCRYPILEGAYGGIGTWKFAAAVAETGAFGLITASVYKTPEKLEDAIKQCRDATGGAFGVNISIGICPRIDEMLDVCISQRVPVETAAYKPDALAGRIRESGIAWVHKSARIKDALHAERLGAHAAIIVGLEGVGFKNPEQLPTLITTTLAKKMLHIPLIAAGGIADASGFMGVLGMGADALMMGTAFMATDECPLGKTAKEKIIGSSPMDPRLRHQVLSPPDPQAYREVMALRGELPVDKWLRMLERVNLKYDAWRTDVEADGEYSFDEEWGREGPSKIVSLAAGVLERVMPVKEFIGKMVHDAETRLEKMALLRAS